MKRRTIIVTFLLAALVMFGCTPVDVFNRMLGQPNPCFTDGTPGTCPGGVDLDG